MSWGSGKTSPSWRRSGETPESSKRFASTTVMPGWMLRSSREPAWARRCSARPCAPSESTWCCTAPRTWASRRTARRAFTGRSTSSVWSMLIPIGVTMSNSSNCSTLCRVAASPIRAGEAKNILLVLADVAKSAAARVMEPALAVIADGVASRLVSSELEREFELVGLTQAASHRAAVAHEGKKGNLEGFKMQLKACQRLLREHGLSAASFARVITDKLRAGGARELFSHHRRPPRADLPRQRGPARACGICRQFDQSARLARGGRPRARQHAADDLVEPVQLWVCGPAGVSGELTPSAERGRPALLPRHVQDGERPGDLRSLGLANDPRCRAPIQLVEQRAALQLGAFGMQRAREQRLRERAQPALLSACPASSGSRLRFRRSRSRRTSSSVCLRPSRTHSNGIRRATQAKQPAPQREDRLTNEPRPRFHNRHEGSNVATRTRPLERDVALPIRRETRCGHGAHWKASTNPRPFQLVHPGGFV